MVKRVRKTKQAFGESIPIRRCASGAALLSFLLVVVGGAQLVLAQDRVQHEVIDLAGPKTSTRDVAPGTKLRIRVLSIAPGRSYSFAIRKIQHEIEPLAPMKQKDGHCAELSGSLDGLLSATLEERAVASAADVVRKRIDDCDNPDLVSLARRTLDLTVMDLGITTVDKGEAVVVTITRGEVAWKATYDAGRRGEWQGSYGFVYSPSGDELYFSKPTSAGKFRITRTQDRDGFGFTPMGFYSWIPSSQSKKPLAFGLAGGLGFQSERPSVAIALTVAHNRNVALIVGGLMRSVKVLSGQYDQASLPEVAENLTDAQIHASTYRPTVFFGVTFRFGESPFGNGDGVEKAKPVPTPSPTPKPATPPLAGTATPTPTPTPHESLHEIGK